MTRATSEQVDALRMSLADYFRRLPEVPVYRRRDDPVRKVAAERAEEGRVLMAKLKELGGAPGAAPLEAALQAHLDVLGMLVDGRVEAAEGPWHDALALERAAVSARRLWSRTDEVAAAVYTKDAGTSRYDPRPETAVQVKLACPNSGCRKVEDFDFSARVATHQFVCVHCQTRFYAYFAELLDLDVQTKGKHHHRYKFRVRELNGEQTRIEFDDSAPGVLSAARGDLLAFLYAPRSTLRGVLDLSSSRVLWVTTSGCFVATAAFGEGAPELDAFRRFRDDVLLPRAAGRAFVRAYYAVGPSLAGVVVRVPGLRGATRRALAAIHRRLA